MSEHSGDKTVDRRSFPVGEYIFRQGDRGTHAYVVQSGSVQIIHRSGEREKVLGQISQGGIFGEMALIDDSPRMADARTREAVTLMVIDRETFRRKLKGTDPFIRGLLNIFVRNIRDLTDQLSKT